MEDEVGPAPEVGSGERQESGTQQGKHRVEVF